MEHRVRVLPPEVLMEQLLGLLDSAEYVPLNISGSSSKSKTITGLSRGKKYYVKVRACKKVGKESYFSAWSAVKLIRVK